MNMIEYAQTLKNIVSVHKKNYSLYKNRYILRFSFKVDLGKKFYMNKIVSYFLINRATENSAKAAAE